MAIGRSGEFEHRTVVLCVLAAISAGNLRSGASASVEVQDRRHEPLLCGGLIARLTETAPTVVAIALVVPPMARRRGMPEGPVLCGRPNWRCRLRRQDSARSLGGLRALDDRVDLAPIEPNAPAFGTVVVLNPLAV